MLRSRVMIARVGHISTNLYEDLRKAQNVGVYVEPDRGGPVVMPA
jgi:hypothetical protein